MPIYRCWVVIRCLIPFQSYGFVFKFFCDVAKVVIIRPLEDIVKFGYKGNKKVKIFKPSLKNLATYWNQIKKFGKFLLLFIQNMAIKNLYIFHFLFFKFCQKNYCCACTCWLVWWRDKGLYLRDTYCTFQFLPLLSDGHSWGGIGRAYFAEWTSIEREDHSTTEYVSSSKCQLTLCWEKPVPLAFTKFLGSGTRGSTALVPILWKNVIRQGNLGYCHRSHCAQTIGKRPSRWKAPIPTRGPSALSRWMDENK